MELLIKAKIDNLFKDKTFTSKETGETKVGKWKIQTFQEIETQEGKQLKLESISITDEMYEKLKTKIGEVVTIPVKTFTSVKGVKVGFYGI